ncbi:NucA/NucB deoxyribonuclease domain-containing protein [Actinomadura sp. GTD37]|uniref:NucA/NucB deoxyribonuclease domain-containing protein n=1 Tax=Actinomadura sp. GTD37 TaxID=1778030 RepID=UPI0035C16E2E
MTPMRRRRFPLLVAAIAAALSVTLTAFTPSPHNPANIPATSTPTTADSLTARRDPNDPAKVKGYLERLQRGDTVRQEDCGAIRFKGREARLCLRTIDPKKAAKAPATVQRRAADPTPPQALCSSKPGQTNYDRFHACYETVRQIEILQDGTVTVHGQVRTDVWATLSASNRTWLMQVGITPLWLSPELVQVGPGYIASLTCATNQCTIPDPVRKKIAPSVYTYYEMPTSIPPVTGVSIQYSNPQIKLALSVDDGAVLTPASPANDPFNVRCDKESYIGGEGCVFYMGNAAAATFYMDYNVADTKYGDYREVVKHNLYAIRVRDNLKHYGDIQYGNPLHRADPITHDQNRATICTTAYQQKASSLGLSCDEYPYASSEEGGTQNPRFSCAFLPLTENTAHGNALNNRLFRENRILPALNEGGTYIQGDPYWVWVTNAPADSQIPTTKQCSQY